MQSTQDTVDHKGWKLPLLDAIGERLKGARRMVDLKAQIGDHPWHALIAAALFGAWVAVEAPKPVPGEASMRSKIAAAVVTTAGAIALRVLREVALREAGTAARRWYESATAPQRTPSAWAPHS